jgi:hypothetical protein
MVCPDKSIGLAQHMGLRLFSALQVFLQYSDKKKEIAIVDSRYSEFELTQISNPELSAYIHTHQPF